MCFGMVKRLRYRGEKVVIFLDREGGLQKFTPPFNKITRLQNYKIKLNYHITRLQNYNNKNILLFNKIGGDIMDSDVAKCLRVVENMTGVKVYGSC